MVKWDLSFKVDQTTELYRTYHHSSSHSPLLQMKKSPRIDYKVKNLDTPNRQVKYIIDEEMMKMERINDVPFIDVIKKRRTSWEFSEESVTVSEFLQIMHISFGITEFEQMKRSYPSGGQFYSVEIYIMPTERSIQSGMLEGNIYKYNVNSNEIVEMHPFDPTQANKISASTEVGLFDLETSQFIVVLVGNDTDLAIKYLDLSYRIMMLEAGHMAQNFLLSCTAYNQSSVPLGGYHESVIRNMLKLHDRQIVLYTLLGG